MAGSSSFPDGSPLMLNNGRLIMLPARMVMNSSVAESADRPSLSSARVNMPSWMIVAMNTNAAMRRNIRSGNRGMADVDFPFAGPGG